MKKIMLILGLASLFLAVGCGQKETAKPKANARSASAIVNKMVGTKAQPRTVNTLQAPDFTLKNVNGDLFSLSEFKGKVVLLNFWGTWCAPCRKEIPDFNNLYSKHQNDGLEIVGIALSSGSADEIAGFMKEWNMKYTVLTDINGNETMQVTGLYGKTVGQPINGIPTTFILDREGNIVKKYVGPRSEEVFFNDLKAYL